MKHKVFVIAEAGVNHDGIVADALRLVDAAADAGADCVKFQTFDAASLASDQASKAVYQQRTTDPAESQKEMLQRLQLPHSAHYSLKQHAAKREIEFLSTPFDRGSLAFLVDELGLRKVKVGSGDLTNAPSSLEIARAGVSAVCRPAWRPWANRGNARDPGIRISTSRSAFTSRGVSSFVGRSGASCGACRPGDLAPLHDGKSDTIGFGKFACDRHVAFRVRARRRIF